MQTTNGLGDSSEAAAHLAGVLRTRKADIVRRWLERVERDVVKSGIDSSDLKDGIAEYLDALADALTHRAGLTFEEAANAAWSGVAQEHGLNRVRLGFDLNQLIHEFVLLRRTIASVAEQGSDAKDLVAELIEAGMAQSARAYVTSRDHQLRLKEAEHVGFIAHELKNPIHAAMLALTQLKQAGADGTARPLQVLDRSLKRVRDLLENVLNAEQFDLGTIKPSLDDLRLGDVLADPLDTARNAAETKGLKFEATYDPETHVRVDKLLTRGAVVNLLDNAIKYSDEGGVRLVATDEPSSVLLHVYDSCGGVSDEQLRVLFEPYRRAPSNKPGSGLGLTVARRTAEAQGGRLEAESTGKRGCHFWMTLPKPPH